jgi:flavin-binding protein dodecin
LTACTTHHHNEVENLMATSVARITTITARSEKSFEDAVRVGVDRANSTLRGVSGAWIKEQKLHIVDGKVGAYQVTMEVTFVLDD